MTRELGYLRQPKRHANAGVGRVLLGTLVETPQVLPQGRFIVSQLRVGPGEVHPEVRVIGSFFFERLLRASDRVFAAQDACTKRQERCACPLAAKAVQQITLGRNEDVVRVRPDPETLRQRFVRLVGLRVHLQCHRVFSEPGADLGILKRGGVHLPARHAPGREEVDEHQLVFHVGPLERLVDGQLVKFDTAVALASDGEQQSAECNLKPLHGHGYRKRRRRA